MSTIGRFFVITPFVCMILPGQTKAPRLDKMPEALETSFALSAVPPHLRQNVTVYLLDPAQGAVVKREGTNGVGCIVVRTDWQFSKEPFRDDVFWPVCFDA